MSIEDLVAAQADPQLPYECAVCETRHRYRVAAAWCCDLISNELDHERGFERGYD